MMRRVGFSPEPPIKEGGAASTKANGHKKRAAILRIWSFNNRFATKETTRFSPASFFRNVGENFAKALRFVSSRRRCLRLRKVSSSASLARSRSYAETLDSQRAEAIEDCIEFLNSSSSSSLPRSNSVASSSV